MKNFKALNLFFLFLFFTLPTTYYLLPTIYAQHEGHQMQPAAKEEVRAKVNKPAVKGAVYYCPMHPSYTSDKPGDCPICNMKLVKKEEAQEIEEAVKGPQEKEEGVYISLEKQQLIGVKTDKVIYRPLTKTIRTVGRVAFDPELYKAQQEYIEAINTLESVKGSGQQEIIDRAEALVEAGKLKLKLQGLDVKQIEELEEERENDESLLISSDADSAWVYATIYEYELEWVKIGQEVTISAASYPGKEFKGKIVAIDPVFNAMTRSVRARIRVENVGSLLKPDMYVDIQIYSDLGAHLSVPREAILDSGLRKIVFLVLDKGRFSPVDVKIGFQTDEYAQVVEGLKENDTIVVSGNFLIDSESKLKAALEGAGHQHGQ